jgi:hypothetical protein
MNHSLYFSCAQVSCFDGEVDNGGDPPAGAASGGAGGAAGGTAGGESKTFTQDQLNAILAEDRRKHQAQLTKVEESYKQLLANGQNLSEQERKTLEENLATVQGQLRTKEQQTAIEKKELLDQYDKKIKESEERAVQWETKYRNSTISRELKDAAVSGEAYNPDQIVSLLRASTKMVEIVDEVSKKSTGEFKTVVEFSDVNPDTGEPVLTLRTPAEAVKRMRELPETYGNLFKSNVVSGLGGNSSTAGLPAGSNGRIDPSKLTTEQYMKLRKERPDALGIR